MSVTKRWHVWLKIDKGCFVQDIKVINMKVGTLYPKEVCNRQSNRIGPGGCPSGKDAPGDWIKKRRDGEGRAPYFMQVAKQDEKGESIHVLQALNKWSIDLNSPWTTGIAGRLDRHGNQVSKWAVDYADGMISDFHTLFVAPSMWLPQITYLLQRSLYYHHYMYTNTSKNSAVLLWDNLVLV